MKLYHGFKLVLGHCPNCGCGLLPPRMHHPKYNVYCYTDWYCSKCGHYVKDEIYGKKKKEKTS